MGHSLRLKVVGPPIPPVYGTKMAAQTTSNPLYTPTTLLSLCVPRLQVLPGFVETSYSKVKLAPGLFEAIRFVPWEEFDNHTKRTKEKLDQLDPEILASVRREVDSIRHKITPAARHESLAFDDALQRLFGSSSTQPPFSRSSSQVGSTASTGHGHATGRDESTHLDVSNDSWTVFYRNTSSCTRVNSKVFDLVENLTRYVRCERKYLLISQMQLSSEVGKKYELLLAPKDFCNIVPDIALTTTQEHPVRELPICSFELKGPLGVFWRQPQEMNALSLPRPAKKKRSTSSSAQTEGAETSNWSQEPPLLKRHDKPEYYTAKGIAKFYNEILDDSTLLARSSDKNSYYHVFLPVAQAVVQALLTESGCSVLYTHQEAIAFEVFKPAEPEHGINPENKRRPIRVRVSRAFPCDEEPGNICALVALANYSCDQAERDEKKREVRELFNRLTHRQYEQRLRKGQNNSGTRERGQQAQDGKECHSPSAPADKKHSSRSISRPLFPSHHQFDTDDVIFSNLRDDDFTRALAEIIATSEGVIGIGSSAIVLGGLYKGRRVAIKSWNGVNREGLHCFLHEIEMYKFLLQSKATVLGNGIPFVRIARACPVEDAVLIVDYVGETIKRADNGKLMVGSGKRWVELQKRDIEDLGRAAVHSLRLLHHSGILHGDISLRNLRGQRLHDLTTKSKPFWRAWWIDLGLSRHCLAQLEREVEVQECVRLFPEASIESTISRE